MSESNAVVESAPAEPVPRRFEILFVFVLALAGVVIFVSRAQFSAAASAQSPRHEAAGFPLDDAWIHQVYARSIALHGRFEYNPGAAEVGLTSPLWALLLAPTHRGANEGPPSIESTAAVVSSARTVGAVVWFVLALAAAFLARSIPTPAPRVAGAIAAILVALDPELAFAAFSGMEPLLFAALVAFAAVAYLRRAPLVAGMLAGIAILARPEGIVISVLLAVGALLPRRDRTSGPKSRLDDAVKILLPGFVCALAWALFCYRVSGRPLPNTYYVKAEHVALGEAITATARTFFVLLNDSVFFRVPTTYLLLLIAIVGIVARGGARCALVLMILPLLLIASVATSRILPVVEPLPFYWQRYMTPAVPFIDIVLAIGIAGAFATMIDVTRKKAGVQEPGMTVPAPLLGVLLFVLVALPFSAVSEGLRASIARFGKQVADVDRTNVAASIALAAESGDSKEKWIAAQDAGAVRYFSNRPVLDLIGLNDHELVSIGMAGGDVGGYIAARRPATFFLLDPDAGAQTFSLLAMNLGLTPKRRFAVPDYSVLGPPQDKGIVLFEASR